MNFRAWGDFKPFLIAIFLLKHSSTTQILQNLCFHTHFFHLWKSGIRNWKDPISNFLPLAIPHFHLRLFGSKIGTQLVDFSKQGFHLFSTFSIFSLGFRTWLLDFRNWVSKFFQLSGSEIGSRLLDF